MHRGSNVGHSAPLTSKFHGKKNRWACKKHPTSQKMQRKHCMQQWLMCTRATNIPCKTAIFLRFRQFVLRKTANALVPSVASHHPAPTTSFAKRRTTILRSRFCETDLRIVFAIDFGRPPLRGWISECELASSLT